MPNYWTDPKHYIVKLVPNSFHCKILNAHQQQLFDFYLFADDTNLLYAENDLNKLEVVVNEELLKLCEWLNSNKLSLNVSKSNCYFSSLST